MPTLFANEFTSAYRPPRTQEKPQTSSIGYDYSRILQKLSHPKTKAILLEAPPPGNRNEVMIDLANYLDMQEVPFATSNAYCAEEGHCERLDRFARSLDRYSTVEKTETVILLDSGDDLYLWRRSISRHFYDELKRRNESPRLGRSLSKDDMLALKIYETCHTIIRTLKSPTFKVIMTFQKHRGEEDYEPNLLAAWREAFPYGSDIRI